MKNSNSTSLMSINVRVAQFKVSKTLTFYSIMHQDPRVPIGNMLKSHYDEYQMDSNPQTLGATSVIKPVELHNYFPEAIDLRLHFTHGSLKQRCRSRHAVQYGQLILTMWPIRRSSRYLLCSLWFNTALDLTHDLLYIKARRIQHLDHALFVFIKNLLVCLFVCFFFY